METRFYRIISIQNLYKNRFYLRLTTREIYYLNEIFPLPYLNYNILRPG